MEDADFFSLIKFLWNALARKLMGIDSITTFRERIGQILEIKLQRGDIAVNNDDG